MKTIVLWMMVACQVEWMHSRVVPNPIEAVYASSVHRQGRLLENVTQLGIHPLIGHAYHCLHLCLLSAGVCKSFNYAWHNSTCILLGESLCSQEEYRLTPDDRFSYYDLMNNPDSESKHLSSLYCQVDGKCSGKCYPRRPHLVTIPMTRQEALEHCSSLGRTLPQPKSQGENGFYGQFGREAIEQLQLLNSTDNSKHKKRTISSAARERQLAGAKYWIGITDSDIEGLWMFDDGTGVADSFSAWSVAQPDNGGAFAAAAENCAVMEMRELNWMDVNCKLKLHFYCA